MLYISICVSVLLAIFWSIHPYIFFLSHVSFFCHLFFFFLTYINFFLFWALQLYWWFSFHSQTLQRVVSLRGPISHHADPASTRPSYMCGFAFSRVKILLVWVTWAQQMPQLTPCDCHIVAYFLHNLGIFHVLALLCSCNWFRCSTKTLPWSYMDWIWNLAVDFMTVPHC